MFEQHFVHTREQKVDKIFIDSINLSFEEWLTFPGIQSYWKLSSDLFVPEFRMHVDDLVEKVEERGYHSSFKQ